MSQLYDMVRQLDQLIQSKGLPFARTKGLVVIKAGFSLVLIEPSTPDDPVRVAKLRAAVRDVIGENL